ncbi:MAG TPA: YceD family protein [Pseudonocardiaceae bacterium]|nr:YceD family protein [Pseudonocardiaceae bacterium]
MPRRATPSRPDPSAPWVIHIRELGRRSGAMRCYHRQIPVPAGLGLDVIGVPEGDEVTLDVRLESVVEGVLVSGTAVASVAGECTRCLDPMVDRVQVELTELFAYPDTATAASTDPDEVSRVVDDLVDLEPLVRDAVLLALPQAPLCRANCPGLCPECGGKWAELGAEHRHETMDPRWAALKRFSESDNQGIE